MNTKAQNMRAVYHELSYRRPADWSLVAQVDYLTIRGAPGMKGGNTGPRRRAKFKVTPTSEDGISVLMHTTATGLWSEPVAFEGRYFAEDFYRWADQQLTSGSADLAAGLP